MYLVIALSRGVLLREEGTWAENTIIVILDNTSPVAYPNESVSITVHLLASNCVRIGADVNIFFIRFKGLISILVLLEGAVASS